jgi:hypothetical protein
VTWRINRAPARRTCSAYGLGSPDGVDGLITDYPDRLRNVLAARGFKLPKKYDGPKGHHHWA